MTGQKRITGPEESKYNAVAIRTEGLSKAFGTINALDGLTLEIPAGTVFGFLGPNGAGKTTTLRMLTGLAKPTAGQAWIAGIPITQQEKLAQSIGYLPEEPSFYNWMTPVDFLDHIGRVFGLQANIRQARVRALLDQVGLAESAKRRIGGFSRGMRQRLGLAQALINQPEVLLLDEPVSALDPAGRKEVLEMISQLGKKCTVLMSTHILADVERVCDTVGILNRGKLVVEAPQAELLARYTIPAFELECEPAEASRFKIWVEELRILDWAESMVINGSTSRLVVNDLETARHVLLQLVAQSGIAFRRYEVVTPTLEDIFLRLVGQDAIDERMTDPRDTTDRPDETHQHEVAP